MTKPNTPIDPFIAVTCAQCGSEFKASPDVETSCPVCDFTINRQQQQAPPVLDGLPRTLMRCPACGHVVSRGAAACPACGDRNTNHPLNQPADSSAALASLIIPGAGQFMQGRTGEAMVLFVIGIILDFVLIGLLIHAWAAFDAFRYRRPIR